MKYIIQTDAEESEIKVELELWKRKLTQYQDRLKSYQ